MNSVDLSSLAFNLKVLLIVLNLNSITAIILWS